eukprot:1517672-Amphidinium_carterae.1
MAMRARVERIGGAFTLRCAHCHKIGARPPPQRTKNCAPLGRMPANDLEWRGWQRSLALGWAIGTT